MDHTIKSTLQTPAIIALLTFLGLPAPGSAQEGLDSDRIASAAGVKATITSDGVVRIAWARTDVPVKVDGVLFNPFAGLGSWETWW